MAPAGRTVTANGPSVADMRTEDPSAILHRLRARPSADPAGSPADGGEETQLAPSWVVPGATTPRGQAWLTAIRADPGRAGGVVLAVIALLAVLVTVFTVSRNRPAPVVSADLPTVEAVPVATAVPGSPVGPDQHTVVVSVVGLVAQPGLVTLAPDARVSDAVSAAGGPVKGADTLGLNLARHLSDGEQIVVGVAAPAGQPAVLGSSVGGAAQAGPTENAPPAGPVDLNTATVEQLDALPGVGPVTAAAIVSWRTANGRFTAVDQLAEVDGIGPARLERLRPLVRV